MAKNDLTTTTKFSSRLNVKTTLRSQHQSMNMENILMVQCQVGTHLLLLARGRSNKQRMSEHYFTSE